MKLDTFSLEVPPANSSGAPQLVQDLVEKTVLVTGTFVGTVRLRGSIDGMAYHDLDTFTAPEAATFDHAVKYVRLHCDAGLTGTPVVSLAGFNARSV